MSRTALKAVAAAVVLAASIGMPLAILRSGQVQARERREALRLQAVRLAELTAAHQRLSNLAAQARSAALSTEQLRELLRLRGEIKSLRQTAAEADRLRAQTQRSAAAP